MITDAGGLPYIKALSNQTAEESYNQGFYYVFNTYATKIGLPTAEGLLLTIKPIKYGDSKDDAIVQIFMKYDGTVFCWRIFNWSTQTWASWKDF